MRTPSVLVLGVAGVGLVFVWSSIHGANVAATLKDLLAGRAAPTPGTDPDLGPAAVGAQVGAQAGTAAGGVGAAAVGAQAGVAAGISHSAAGNRANGQLQAAARGWTGDQWTALDKLWTRESDWNNLARNPSSGAYGIAQFLDQTWASYGGSKTSDPTLQIRYGLAYIAARYGTPAAAWAHEQGQGWY